MVSRRGLLWISGLLQPIASSPVTRLDVQANIGGTGAMAARQVASAEAMLECLGGSGHGDAPFGVHSLAAATEQQPSAAGPVPEAHPVAESQEAVPTPKPSSPAEEEDQAPPPPLQSAYKAIVGPSRASLPDDVKDHQALFQ